MEEILEQLVQVHYFYTCTDLRVPAFEQAKYSYAINMRWHVIILLTTNSVSQVSMNHLTQGNRLTFFLHLSFQQNS